MRRLALVSTLAAAVLLASGWAGNTTVATAKESCGKVARPTPHEPKRLKPPRARLDPAKRWVLTFRTTCGTFAVLLQPKTSPHATAFLVALARKRYFDGTIFHRIVPGFVIQGGDPTQTGRGGPGSTTVDTPKPGTRYVKGVMAMGKTLTEPAGAAGSQFFVMTGDAPTLPPDYAVVGRVVSGAAVTQLIGTFGNPADPNGAPTKIVVVKSVTVSSQ